MTDDKDRLLIHTITNARLVDVSFVKDPANPHAYIKYSAIPENFPVYHEAWKKANDGIVKEISKESLQDKQAQQDYEQSFRKSYIPRRYKGNLEGL